MRKLLLLAGCLCLAAAVSAQTITPISTLRTMVDGNYLPSDTNTLFTIEGIVTTHTNLTTSGHSQFYVQDNTAGIAVFVENSATNRPTAGTRVRVTGPLGHFNGLLELDLDATNSAHVVTTLSTGNPLPAPTLFLNFSQTNNTAFIEGLEGSYIVMSNVFLDLSSATFPSSGNILVTNSSGETFDFRIDARTDIGGNARPPGPVTILGVLGQSHNSNPRTEGYQIIPTRFADILSSFRAPTVQFTNILSNLVRPGDALTNSTFKDYALRPTETITIRVVSSDSKGSNVTVTAFTDTLPPHAQWTVGPSGTSVASTFTFTPLASDAGSNFVVRLQSAMDSGTNTTIWNIYVPTVAEQNIVISEFLANPTTATNSPYFNPLHRTTGSTNAFADDEFVEIVNLGNQQLDLLSWRLFDDASLRHEFYDNFPIASSNAIIVFGGPKNVQPQPALPVPSAPLSESVTGVSVFNNGSDAIVLRNDKGFVVARVVYTSVTATNGIALTRFPFMNSGFVAHDQVSCTNASAGFQYDLRPYSAPAMSNSPPTITAIADRSVSIGTSTGPISFTVGDAQTAAGSLTVSGTSSNPTLVPNGNITFGGSGANRTVTVTPASGQSGTATITVTVLDANFGCAMESFVLTVLATDNPPSISSIPDQRLNINSPSAALPFTVSDRETPAAALTLSGSSSNSALIPNGNIVFGGSGSNRTVTVTPTAGQTGTSLITVVVSDGAFTNFTSFLVTVAPTVLLCDAFDYPDGSVTTNSGFFWKAHSGITGQTDVVSSRLEILGSQTEDINAQLTNAPYGPVANINLYASFDVVFTTLPTGTGGYFTHFKDATTSGFRARVFSVTNNAAPGTFRLGIANAAGSFSVQLTNDLALNTTNRVVVRYNLGATNSTLWVNPADEATGGVTATDTTTGLAISTYAFRQATGIGSMFIDNLKVGTTFDTVVPPSDDVELKIAYLGGGDVRISWPVSATDYVLQTTPSFTPRAWMNAGVTPVQQGDENVVILNDVTGMAFYRLANN